MRRILFVDDDPNVLEGLRDALRSRRREWRMVFVDGGESALAELERDAYDVVVSDMRMPVMDGAELLSRVRRHQPHTVRIVLTGYADGDGAARAATVAHRFLSKPCDVNELSSVIERSCALVDLAREQELRRSAVRAACLPSAPGVYEELNRVLLDPSTGMRDAAAVVEQDTAMVAKVLQLANSGFFGLPRRVTRLEEAVTFLGLGTLRSLTLAAEAFCAFTALPPAHDRCLERLRERGRLVAGLVGALLPDGPARDDAVAAALLADIGLLVLATEEPDHLADALSTARAEGRSVADIEYERRGVSHAEVGAYLLALWDLPHGVIEAVAFHHRPPAAGDPVPAAVAALHIADALADDPHVALPWPADAGAESWLTRDVLESTGLAAHLPAARAIAAAAAEAAEPRGA
jgi:HD-like signal output (HDOD) protein